MWSQILPVQIDAQNLFFIIYLNTSSYRYERLAGVITILRWVAADNIAESIQFERVPLVVMQESSIDCTNIPATTQLKPSLNPV